jgi:hypothetical protein
VGVMRRVGLKKIFRLFISLVAFVMLVLATLTVEVASEEFGWIETLKVAIRGRIRAMFDWGYDQWVLRGLIFFSGADVALWIDFIIRKKTMVQIADVDKISGFHVAEIFRNQEVLLDGHSYKNCKFYNVNFVYNGGKC